MVEIFRTNLNNPQATKALASAIRRQFPNYKISFDLDDCDRILRVANTKPVIEHQALFNIARSVGVEMEVLPD
jgi:hypothetical protein